MSTSKSDCAGDTDRLGMVGSCECWLTMQHVLSCCFRVQAGNSDLNPLPQSTFLHHINFGTLTFLVGQSPAKTAKRSLSLSKVRRCHSPGRNATTTGQQLEELSHFNSIFFSPFSHFPIFISSFEQRS